MSASRALHQIATLDHHEVQIDGELIAEPIHHVYGRWMGNKTGPATFAADRCPVCVAKAAIAWLEEKAQGALEDADKKDEQAAGDGP